ncbi:MAG: hypothetical protein JXQ90_13865 [Cyclobacteriaceae bacterium]
MKKIILTTTVILITLASQAQIKLNLGGGYYGETLTYPGVILQLEREVHQSEKFSTPMMVDLGFYNHPRSHSAVFTDVLFGTRRYFENRLFIEHYLGVGVMLTRYSDEVWTVTEEGDPRYISNWANADLSPSITLGIGYDFSNDQALNRQIWLRPKMNWQLPFNGLANPHIAIQFGFSYTLKSK